MKVGFALRSSVFHPSLIVKITPLLDAAGVDSVWFPDAGMPYDALDLSALALGSTRRARVGTGVIRAEEQDPTRLTTRVRTLSESSEGRFILGLGAGRASGPEAIEGVVALAEKVRAGYGGGRKAPIFFAALRSGMVRAALSSADGAILNFCPPSHVKNILPGGAVRSGFTLACYVKLFFAKSDAAARRMLVEEIATYNAYPSYHKMFEAAGVASAIASLGKDSSKIPDGILEISLPNPTKREVARLLRRFARAGVNLPIIYPYVSGGEGYQLEVVKELASVAG
ncbi:MAG: LLM class flavin-dependent oxidoreductase [Thaumarchaeota archaeon]|nr:LLM class flavin-dependent oxidoreductase [Nitrososphaerota archaeon]